MRLPGKTGNVERLVADHYHSLYRYAYRLTGNAVDAEDLTQESFCKAQEKWSQLREPERAKAWLFSILRNAYLHRARAEKNHRLVSLDDVGEVADQAAESLPLIEPSKLQEALDVLPEVFRTPLILYYFEEFSYRDIAEQMDLPLGTVMSRLARAKNFLRSRLLGPDVEMTVLGTRREKDGL